MSDLDAATTKLLEEAKALAADAAVHATKAETASNAGHRRVSGCWR